MSRFMSSAATVIVALFLAACGGGGGGSTAAGTTTTAPQNSATTTTVSGMASKGPVTGTATLYFLNADGSKGGVLATASVDNGIYAASIGKYAGPVLVEVIGRYTDEATGQTKTITTAAPLRAALAYASDTVSIAVTPLTELAVQKAGALTSANITAGNKLISDIFKIDVTTVQPVAPTSAALSGTSVTQSQKDYTLVIAALSQLSLTQHDTQISTTLTNIASSISYSGMTGQAVTGFQKAVSDFIASSNNTTGIVAGDPPATDLAQVNGGTTATYTLAIQGTVAAHATKGIQFDVVIPNGLTVRYNTSSVIGDTTKGTPLDGVVTLAEPVAGINPAPTFNAMYSAASGLLSFALYSETGIGTGNLATVICDITPGWSTPPASAFSVRNVKAVDSNAVTISGITVMVN